MRRDPERDAVFDVAPGSRAVSFDEDVPRDTTASNGPDEFRDDLAVSAAAATRLSLWPAIGCQSLRVEVLNSAAKVVAALHAVKGGEHAVEG